MSWTWIITIDLYRASPCRSQEIEFDYSDLKVAICDTFNSARDLRVTSQGVFSQCYLLYFLIDILRINAFNVDRNVAANCAFIASNWNRNRPQKSRLTKVHKE